MSKPSVDAKINMKKGMRRLFGVVSVLTGLALAGSHALRQGGPAQSWVLLLYFAGGAAAVWVAYFIVKKLYIYIVEEGFQFHYRLGQQDRSTVLGAILGFASSLFVQVLLALSGLFAPAPIPRQPMPGGFTLVLRVPNTQKVTLIVPKTQAVACLPFTRVAVLPFEVQGPGLEVKQQWQEDFISALQRQAPAWQVMQRGQVEAWLAGPEPFSPGDASRLAELGRCLGVSEMIGGAMTLADASHVSGKLRLWVFQVESQKVIWEIQRELQPADASPQGAALAPVYPLLEDMARTLAAEYQVRFTH